MHKCALTKLGYLLSKPELSADQIRELIRTPLRGELSPPPPVLKSQTSEPVDLESVQGVLSQIIRVSSPRTGHPKVIVSLEDDAAAAAAPWSWTNADTLTAESALLPLLTHLAAARNDLEALAMCVQVPTYDDGATSQTEPCSAVLAAGIVNCLDAASGRTPLHVASMNGNAEAVELLLGAGASVHARDALDHTALYYVGACVFLCQRRPPAEFVICSLGGTARA